MEEQSETSIHFFHDHLDTGHLKQLLTELPSFLNQQYTHLQSYDPLRAANILTIGPGTDDELNLIASCMPESGQVIAIERSEERYQALNSKSSKVNNVTVRKARGDGFTPIRTLRRNALLGELKGKIDHILAINSIGITLTEFYTNIDSSNNEAIANINTFFTSTKELLADGGDILLAVNDAFIHIIMRIATDGRKELHIDYWAEPEPIDKSHNYTLRLIIEALNQRNDVVSCPTAPIVHQKKKLKNGYRLFG